MSFLNPEFKPKWTPIKGYALKRAQLKWITNLKKEIQEKYHKSSRGYWKEKSNRSICYTSWISSPSALVFSIY